MPRASGGTPSLARTSASHSTLSAAMSTPAGHSVLQALQATHVPSTSRNSPSPMAARGTAPQTTPWSALARARVARASSRVAAAGGHMVPEAFLQRPAPKHLSTAAPNPPSAAYESLGAQPPSPR